MVEHLTQKQITDYCRQHLSVAQLLSVSDHLANCQDCRWQIECAMNADAASFALRAELFGQAAGPSSQQPGADTHLTTEQMASFVDRVLSGEELLAITDHLVDCEPCALAVDDLNAFKDQVAPSLEREYRPATAPPWAKG